MVFVTFIIVVIIIIAINFFKDSYKENDKLVKEGGIYKKYQTLIDNFVVPEEGFNVVSKTNNYICVAMRNSTGSIVFHFQHMYSEINVTFEMNNILIGKHKLEWNFPETMSQTEMIKQIESRIRQYSDNISSNFK